MRILTLSLEGAYHPCNYVSAVETVIWKQPGTMSNLFVELCTMSRTAAAMAEEKIQFAQTQTGHTKSFPILIFEVLKRREEIATSV